MSCSKASVGHLEKKWYLFPSLEPQLDPTFFLFLLSLLIFISLINSLFFLFLLNYYRLATTSDRITEGVDQCFEITCVTMFFFLR